MIENGTEYGLDARTLGIICPFYLIVDGEGRIRQTGDAIRRLIPEAAIGSAFDACFAIRKPVHIAGLAGLSAHLGRLLLIVYRKDRRFVLRGQLLALSQHGMLIFFGAPCVQEFASMPELGIMLDDFPVHDNITDFLLLMRAQKRSLLDAQQIAQELQELNLALETRVKERTESLARSNEVLAQQTQDLERANAQLNLEKHERQRVESELLLSQKLEAVGQLAAGIAHEINTPVQFVGDNLRFLGDAFDKFRNSLYELHGLAQSVKGKAEHADQLSRIDAVEMECDISYLIDEVPKAIVQSSEGVERVAQIVRAMKEFSHPDQGQKQIVDINKILETTIIVARNEYKYVADLVTDLSSDLPLVPALRSEISQVFLNLIVNAAHAIGDRIKGSGGKGTITIATKRIGQDVAISFTDTGTGIPLDIQSRIFEPFFTTKGVGRGTGQGLTLSRAIVVKKHAGKIDFATTPGIGTTFTVTLPMGGAP